MQISRRFRHVLAAGSLAAGGVLVAGVPAGAAGAASTTKLHPNVGCHPSQPWYTVSSIQQEPFGTGAWDASFNYNATRDISVSVTTTTVSTVQYSVSATVSVEAGIIFTSVAASATVGVSYSHSDDHSFTTTINDVPPGHYGILQGGNTYEVADGTYYWQNMDCKIVSVGNVTGRFPTVLNPIEIAGVSTSDSPPWRQAP